MADAVGTATTDVALAGTTVAEGTLVGTALLVGDAGRPLTTVAVATRTAGDVALAGTAVADTALADVALLVANAGVALLAAVPTAWTGSVAVAVGNLIVAVGSDSAVAEDAVVPMGSAVAENAGAGVRGVGDEWITDP